MPESPSLFDRVLTLDDVEPEDELFGSTLPEGYTPILRGEDGSPVSLAQELERWAKSEPSQPRAKAYDYRKLYPHTMRLLNSMHPGKYWPVDYKEFVPTFHNGRPDYSNGKVISKDMLGFADIGGTARPNGRFVTANVTSVGAIAAHMRKYVSDETHGQAKIRIEAHLREFLDCGGLLYVIGWHKPKRNWEPKVLAVTPELLDIYKARRRK